MQVTATEDIAASIEHVFAELTDYQVLERQALRRGIDVRRTFKGPAPQIGEGWNAKFRFRGKEREALILLDGMEAPHALSFSGTSGGLNTRTQIELVPLSPTRTRVNVVFKMVPQSLWARLLVQSFKMARSTINTRFKKRMAGYARDIESKVAKSA